MVDKKHIAIIPARGGSKRIPKKNIRPFAGKAMIAWTIEAALNANLFDRVLVSTDSQEIADIAMQHGADVPFLRESCVDDHASSSEATLHALSQTERYLGERFHTVTQLMPNCPLRTASLIQAMHDDFIQHDSAFLLSCFQFEWQNPWWAVKLNQQNMPQHLFPEALSSRSQDLDKLYCPTGAVWMARVSELVKSRNFYGPGHRFYPISWRYAVDIDNLEDWEMAEFLFQFNQKAVCPA